MRFTTMRLELTVVEHPGYAIDLVHNAPGHPLQKLPFKSFGVDLEIDHANPTQGGK